MSRAIAFKGAFNASRKSAAQVDYTRGGTDYPLVLPPGPIDNVAETDATGTITLTRLERSWFMLAEEFPITSSTPQLGDTITESNGDVWEVTRDSDGRTFEYCDDAKIVWRIKTVKR